MAPEVLSATSCHLQGYPECSAPGTGQGQQRCWAPTWGSSIPLHLLAACRGVRVWQGCAQTSLHTPPWLEFQVKESGFPEVTTSSQGQMQNPLHSLEVTPGDITHDVQVPT